MRGVGENGGHGRGRRAIVDADYEIRELEQEAERKGYVLQWTFDQDKNDFEYTCEKMTSEEYEQYLEWEKEE